MQFYMRSPAKDWAWKDKVVPQMQTNVALKNKNRKNGGESSDLFLLQFNNAKQTLGFNEITVNASKSSYLWFVLSAWRCVVAVAPQIRKRCRVIIHTRAAIQGCSSSRYSSHLQEFSAQWATDNFCSSKVHTVDSLQSYCILLFLPSFHLFSFLSVTQVVFVCPHFLTRERQ